MVCAMPTQAFDANCAEAKKCTRMRAQPRFVSIAILIMLLVLVSLVYLNS
jgi:hypothetical protein